MVVSAVSKQHNLAVLFHSLMTQLSVVKRDQADSTGTQINVSFKIL